MRNRIKIFYGPSSSYLEREVNEWLEKQDSKRMSVYTMYFQVIGQTYADRQYNLVVHYHLLDDKDLEELDWIRNGFDLVDQDGSDAIEKAE